jgi:murein DD-endopeptidase MepM/ murein hydrolase activator NlpD
MQAFRHDARLGAFVALVLLVGAVAAGCARPQAREPAQPPALPAKEPVPPPKPPPERTLRLSLARDAVAQGEFVVVRCSFEGGDPSSVSAAGLDAKASVHTSEGRGFAILPVGVRTAVGAHKITVQASWPDGATRSAEVTVTVSKTSFQVSRITATKEQTDSISAEKLAQDSAKVRAAKAASSPTSLWTSGFQAPLEAKITTGFGHTRYVNGIETWRHSGIDFGAPTGTKVGACADGKVVMATTLNGTGKTVILDHGMNVFSSYGHMSSLAVNAGDQVKKGQTVGLVGSTGFSTGPHLHWTITIGLVAVDPFSLVKRPEDLGF